MDASAKRNIQIVMAIVILVAGARTAWIFYQRHQEYPTKESAPQRKLHADDYVYLRPSHAYDFASTKKFLTGKTVWVRAGNAYAYSWFTPPNRVTDCRPAKSPDVSCVLSPLAKLDVKDVVMQGTQMYAVFSFADIDVTKLSSRQNAAPIGVIKNGDANIVIDELFFYEDPHKLYDHWTKDDWAAIERHEITKGMSEAQASAAMGVPHAPESGASGEYGNRTLVFSDPASEKSVTVTFADNAAVTISK